MATKENETFTYRVRPDGDGRYYVGAKYNEKGEEVEVVTQRHMSEPDAEKELRSIASHNDVIATPRLHSVDADDNSRIVVESSDPADTKRFGATVKYTDVDNTGGSPVTAADIAVAEGKVSTVADNTEPTDAEKKQQEAVAKKVEARREKEEGE